MPEVARIADRKRGAGGETQRHLIGPPAPDHEADAARAQGPLDLLQALEHEGIVAPVGVGIAGHQAEADDHRQPQPVGLADRMLERRVARRPLRLLHPVEHVGAGDRRAIVQRPEAPFEGHAASLAQVLAADPMATLTPGRRRQVPLDQTGPRAAR